MTKPKIAEATAICNGDHTYASVPKGEHGDTATIHGVPMTCVLRGMHTLWLPTCLSHLTEVRDGQ